MFDGLIKILKVLNSETSPVQISLALALGMVAGLTPLLSLHNLLVLCLVLVLRVNLSTFLLGLAVFSGVAYLFDPLFHRIGLWLLTQPALQDMWTSLYNSVIWRLTRYNNTIVMGSLTVSVVLFLPLIWLTNTLIRRYRDHVLAWVQKTKLVQIVKASKFYNRYQSLAGLGD